MIDLTVVDNHWTGSLMGVDVQWYAFSLAGAGQGRGQG